VRAPSLARKRKRYLLLKAVLYVLLQPAHFSLPFGQQLRTQRLFTPAAAVSRSSKWMISVRAGIREKHLQINLEKSAVHLVHQVQVLRQQLLHLHLAAHQ
jgi:hypothetical protein